MTLDTWVSLAAMAAGFAGVAGYLRSALLGVRGEIAALRSEFKADIASCHTAIDNLRTELKSDITDLRTELKGDIAGLRADLSTLGDRIYHLNTSATGLLTRETHRSQTG